MRGIVLIGGWFVALACAGILIAARLKASRSEKAAETFIKRYTVVLFVGCVIGAGVHAAVRIFTLLDLNQA